MYLLIDLQKYRRKSDEKIRECAIDEGFFPMFQCLNGAKIDSLSKNISKNIVKYKIDFNQLFLVFLQNKCSDESYRPDTYAFLLGTINFLWTDLEFKFS